MNPNQMCAGLALLSPPPVQPARKHQSGHHLWNAQAAQARPPFSWPVEDTWTLEGPPWPLLEDGGSERGRNALCGGPGGNW